MSKVKTSSESHINHSWETGSLPVPAQASPAPDLPGTGIRFLGPRVCQLLTGTPARSTLPNARGLGIARPPSVGAAANHLGRFSGLQHQEGGHFAQEVSAGYERTMLRWRHFNVRGSQALKQTAGSSDLDA